MVYTFPMSRRSTKIVVSTLAALLTAVSAHAAPAQSEPLPAPGPLALALEAPEAQTLAVLAGAPLESRGVRAVVTALVVRNPTAAGEPVRGARLDLHEGKVRDSVFIDEADLVEVKRELDGLDCGLERDRERVNSPHLVRGVARCRPSQSVPQAWCPAYTITPDGEGLTVSVHAGHRYYFAGVRPAQLAAAIGRVLSQFALSDELPPAEMIDLPDEVADQVTLAAIEAHAELGTSAGIKAAGYVPREEDTRVVAVFWPHRQEGDYAHALVVDCNRDAAAPHGWACGEALGRGYLTLADQPRAAVVTGVLAPDTAAALIELTRAAVQAQDPQANWHAVSIRPRDAYSSEHRVRWQSSAGADVTVPVTEIDAPDAARFVASGLRDNTADRCRDAPGG